MLNKKNIAKAMTVATAAAAFAPMTASFAAVVENHQAEEIKALKETVYEVFNARYTENVNLLTTSAIAGQKVYNSVTVEINNQNPVTLTNYAEFSKYFDEKFAKMNNDDVLTVTYSAPVGGAIKGFEGEISDTSVYTVNPTTNKTLMLQDVATSNSTISCTTDGTTITTKAAVATTASTIDSSTEYTVYAVGQRLSSGTYADKKAYVKVPTSEGYITLTSGDVKPDLGKPIYKTAEVDGKKYYVNAAGDTIREYNAAEEHVKAGYVDEMNAIGGVIIGYYPQLVKPASGVSTEKVTAIVKKPVSLDRREYKVSDLYEGKSTDRLTKLGNELVNAISDMINDEASTTATTKDTHRDNMRARVIVLDKAGVEIKDSITTIATTEITTGSNISDLTTMATAIAHKDAKTVKIVVETTNNEQSNDSKDWTPIFEAVITEGRNESFVDFARGFISTATTLRTAGNAEKPLEMPLAAGKNRYASAVEASKAQFKNTTTSTVILVAGNKIVDGLTATPLANLTTAPILLTETNKLPEKTLNEIKRLQATNVIIVGGTKSVSEAVEKDLVENHGLEVERLKGDTREGTSLAVAEKMAEIIAESNNNNDPQNAAKFEQVFVVGSYAEADALSASAIAAQTKSPILLNNASSLDSDVKYFINKNVKDDNNEADVYIVGGRNSVSSNVQTQIANINVINELNNKVEVKRLAGGEGTGRQETNAAVINEFADITTGGIVVAKSDNNGMVDALSAGAYAASEGAALVLATNNLVDDQEDALAKVAGNMPTNLAGTKAKGVKLQSGYGIAKSVVTFVNGLFTRNN